MKDNRLRPRFLPIRFDSLQGEPPSFSVIIYSFLIEGKVKKKSQKDRNLLFLLKPSLYLDKSDLLQRRPPQLGHLYSMEVILYSLLQSVQIKRIESLIKKLPHARF